MRQTVVSDNPFVTDGARHLIDAGGKRFRPMLSLLTGMLGGARADHPDLVSAGVIVELVHLSTLYHDDVIDAADTRRGTPSTHVKWSNTVAILTGDFLLARASELSAALGVEVTRIMARTIAELCEGQILEVQGSLDASRHGAVRREPTRQHYLDVIDGKTASLIRASCRLGALLSGQRRDHIEALTRFGHHLGYAFQLADDVLDIASQETESGKIPGTDLREGVHTMPVLYALEDEGEGSELAALLDDPTEANVEAALSLLRAHQALERARQSARDQAKLAKAALDELDVPPTFAPVMDGLTYLTDYAADRAG
ncbi:polyprenyl synthetase family protein [Euzebya tangerina]|uniref:polyprenyl synthetase family protein n=1 Tax=Euzebya tangerina TaxID=591198 RepID=UPI0039C893CA